MSQTTGAVEVVKFPLPDGRIVEISSEMSTAELLTALRQIVNVWYPLPPVDDPQAEALALTKAYLIRLGELHCLVVVGYTGPVESGKRLWLGLVVGR